METVVFLIICGFMGWFFAKSLRTEPTSKNNITRIDDKNWIVNNEIVSFEEDNSILRLKQEIEDNKHYHDYENEKLNRDRKQIFSDWMKTRQFIHKHPELKEQISDGELDVITEKHDRYLFVCNKLGQTSMVLSKEEFLIKEKNPMFCVDFTNVMLCPIRLGFYEIYNEKTARYYNGDMESILAKEFEAKWY